MALSTGIAKKLSILAESAWGALNNPSTGGQYLRRVTSDLNMVKATYQSGEIRDDYQIADFRHGGRRVEGSINGELSCKTYQSLIAAAFRASQTWQTAPTFSGSDVTAQAGAPQFATAAGDFLAGGLRIGHVVRWTGFAGGGATANNSRNFLITALTASSMTGIFLDGTAVVADSAGDSVTCTGFKYVYPPSSSHTDTSFSVEHWHSDISQSEVFLGCKVNSMGISLPASGLATINFGFLGADVQTDTSQQMSSPSAAPTTGIMAAVNGALFVNGTKYATITGLNINYAGGMTGEAVVGSNAMPAVFPGRINISGDMSCYFENGTIRDLFIDETASNVVIALSAGNGATDDVFAISLPKVKFGSFTKNDGEAGIVAQISFQALKGGTQTGHLDTTIMVTDTAAA